MILTHYAPQIIVEKHIKGSYYILGMWYVTFIIIYYYAACMDKLKDAAMHGLSIPLVLCMDNYQILFNIWSVVKCTHLVKP